MYALWPGPLDNCFNLAGGSSNPSRADFKAEVVHLFLQELALVKSPKQLSFLQLLECPPYMLPMLINAATEY